MRMRGGRHEDARAFCRFVSEVVMMTVIISNCFRGGDDDGITNMTCPLLAADFRDMGYTFKQGDTVELYPCLEYVL